MTRVRRERRSRSLEGVLQALRKTAGGQVISDVTSKLAPTMQKAMHSLLRPHRRTGAAENGARATASGSTIVIENVGYGKFIKNYSFGRRLPNNWVGKLKRALVAGVRRELRRIR